MSQVRAREKGWGRRDHCRESVQLALLAMLYARVKTVTAPTLGQVMRTQGQSPHASSSAVTEPAPAFIGMIRSANEHPGELAPAHTRTMGSPTQVPPENPQAPASAPPVHPKVRVVPGVQL